MTDPTPERLEELRDYMREPELSDRETLRWFRMSRAYLRKAGILPPPVEKPDELALYDLTLDSVALHFYDHRDDFETDAPFARGTQNLINQAKAAGLAGGDGA